MWARASRSCPGAITSVLVYFSVLARVLSTFARLDSRGRLSPRGLLLGFLCVCFRSLLFGPTFFYDLACSSQCQGIWRDIFGDRGGGGDVGAFPDSERRDQDA